MKDGIEARLLQKNTKPTAMRMLVYELLSAQQHALSLSDIESLFDQVDRVTLYRTIKTFEQKGIVHGIHEGHVVKYRLCGPACTEQMHKDWHLHFYCKVCKQTACKTEIKFPPEMLGAVKIDGVQFFAEGLCEDCATAERDDL